MPLGKTQWRITSPVQSPALPGPHPAPHPWTPTMSKFPFFIIHRKRAVHAQLCCCSETPAPTAAYLYLRKYCVFVCFETHAKQENKPPTCPTVDL